MNKEAQKPVIILGGGISGLSAAWYLQQAGVPFTLFEKETEPGGVIRSEVHRGTTLDFGPNTIRDRDGNIRDMIKNLQLTDELITASHAFKTRYIVRNGKAEGISSNPLSFIKSNIISGKAKLRMLAEVFVSSGQDRDESIGHFFERRLGKEIVDYVIDPVFSGIYAGNIYELSKRTLLPKLAEYEQNKGSITWGALRSAKEKKQLKPLVLSFKEGIQQLAYAIQHRISEHIIHKEITSVNYMDGQFVVSSRDDSHISDQLISTIPAHQLCGILSGFDSTLTQTLEEVDYAPVLSTQITFNADQLQNIPEGFGFLVPRQEQIRLLGAIWKTKIFPEQSRDGNMHFTLLTGGEHDHAVTSDPINQIEAEVIDEFSSIMNISVSPIFTKSKLWEHAIPQFKVGYQTKKKVFSIAEEKYKGLYIGGNYNWGASVPDCIKGAKECSERLLLS